MGDLNTALNFKRPDYEELTVNKLEELYPVPMKSPVFRANFYTLVLISEGKGAYSLDENRYDITGKTLYFTNPGHLKSFERGLVYRGYLVSFSESYLKQYVSKQVFETFPFLLSERFPPAGLADADFTFLVSLLEDCLVHYRRGEGFGFEIIGGLLLAALWKLKHIFRENLELSGVLDQGDRIVRKFFDVVESALRSREELELFPNVQDIASDLNIHPNYLQTVIKTRTGKTPNRLISEKIMAEAGSLLINSPLSIKEIAADLKFQDYSSFSRFFKRQSGRSPQEYREQKRS